MGSTLSVETLPPQDLRAEHSVIGASVVSQKALEQCMEVLGPEHFHRPANALIWRCIRALYLRGEAVDSVTVAQELQRSSFEDAAGYIDYVQECIDATPSSANAAHYARIVREKWLRRQVIDLGRQLQAGAFDESTSVEDVIARVMDSALSLQIGTEEAGGLEHISKPMQTIQEMIKTGPLRLTSRTPTGIKPLDYMIGGFQNSDLHYWGGAPGSGKTTLSMQSAYIIARGVEEPPRMVVYFSMELGSVQFARRILSFDTKVHGKILEYGPTSALALEMPKISHGVQRVGNLPMWVSFGRLSTAQIMTRLKQIISRERVKPAVVFVDRLELLSDSDTVSMEETKRIPLLSPRLKGIATSLEVPVVCLAQLNRAGRTGDPTAESFRGSGSIEQDCQVGLIIKTDKDASSSQVWVVKQNDGATGPCDAMRFDERLPMFFGLTGAQQ